MQKMNLNNGRRINFALVDLRKKRGRKMFYNNKKVLTTKKEKIFLPIFLKHKKKRFQVLKKN